MDAGNTFLSRLTERKRLLRLFINRRNNEAHNSKTEGQLMPDKMRARLNGRVAVDIIPENSGAKYGARCIIKTTLTPIKLWRGIQIEKNMIM